MNEINFAYWLKGYFELTDSGQQLSVQQVQVIRDHLDLVFKKVTPNYTCAPSVTMYNKLNLQDGIEFPFIEHTC